MFEKFLLTNFSTRKDQYVNSLEKVKQEVDGIVKQMERYSNDLAGKDNSLNQRNLQELRDLVDRFPVSEFKSLKKSSYLRKQHLFQGLGVGIDQSRIKLTDLIRTGVQNDADNLDLSHEKKSFIEFSNDITTLQKKVSSHFSRIKTGVQSLFLIPIGLSFLLGVYYRSAKGFEVLSKDIIQPQNIYLPEEDRSDVYRYTSEFKEQYWEEFSDYFWLESNEFLESTARQKDFYCKLVLKNRQGTKPLLVHQLSADVVLDEKEFEWQNMDVEPHPEIYLSNDRYLIIDNQNGPPCIDLKISLTDALSDLSFKFEHDRLLSNYTYQDIHALVQEDYTHLDRGLFDDPFYYEYGERPDIPETNPAGQELIFEWSGKWYEVIRDLDRLGEVVRVDSISNIVVLWSYLDLKENKYEEEDTFSLMDPKYFFQKTERLRLDDPRDLYDLAEYDLDGVSDILDLENFIGFAEAFVGPPKYLRNVNGVDMLIDTLTIKLDENGEGSDFRNLDVILNPLGYLVVYIEIEGQFNGIQKLDFRVNGKKACKLAYETYLPPLDLNEMETQFNRIEIYDEDMVMPMIHRGPQWDRETILQANFEIWE